MFARDTKVKIGKTRSATIKPGARGRVVWTWPEGHKYRGKYYQVEVGRRNPKRHILAASVLTEVA